MPADAEFAQGIGKRDVGDAAVKDLLDLSVAREMALPTTTRSGADSR